IDIASTLVMMNDLKFAGSGVDNFAKKRKGDIVPVHYAKREYDEIIDYIHTERDAILGLFAELRTVLTTFGNRKKHLLAEEESASQMTNAS
ncbi:MAG: hypothetical protein JSV43_08300, partial [Methanobacteriota archaeon]